MAIPDAASKANLAVLLHATGLSREQLRELVAASRREGVPFEDFWKKLQALALERGIAIEHIDLTANGYMPIRHQTTSTPDA